MVLRWEITGGIVSIKLILFVVNFQCKRLPQSSRIS